MGILEVKDVGKRFGGLQALGDVNLSVKENTVHAIIGPNGAGKSTLLNCLVGKLIPDTGSVMFDGQSVLGRTPHEINQMGISRVFQTPEIFGDLTVREDHVFNRHLAEALVELYIVADFVGPHLPVGGDIPAFSQHGTDKAVVEVIHPQSFGDWYGAVQEDLGVANQFGVAYVGSKLFLANDKRA